MKFKIHDVGHNKRPLKLCCLCCICTCHTTSPRCGTVVVILSNSSVLVSINEVNLRRARLVLGRVTVSWFNSHSQCWAFILVCNEPACSTQPGHPFVGKRNKYQPKGGDALWLWSKGSCGWQIKLCNPVLTHGPYLSALEINGVYIKRYKNSSVYSTLLSLHLLCVSRWTRSGACDWQLLFEQWQTPSGAVRPLCRFCNSGTVT